MLFRSRRELERDRTALALVDHVGHRLFQDGPPADTHGRLTGFLLRVRERSGDRLRYVVRTVTTPEIEHMRLVSLPPWLHGLYVPIKVLCDYFLFPLWRVTKRARQLGSGVARRRLP